MEAVRGKTSAENRNSQSVSRLIVEEWMGLGRPKVGARELEAIQNALGERLEGAAFESPAAIARVLADEGAELRHPEVIEFDARWREAQIQKDVQQFSEMSFAETDAPLTLERAEHLIESLEKLRSQFEQGADETSLQRIRTIAIEARTSAQLLAKRKALSEPQRAEQLEVAEWLGVWIKTPSLFPDWLELRRRSPEFRKKFSTEKSS